MTGVVVRRAVAMLWAVGGVSRLLGIRVRSCRADACYYGAVFEENGDDADLAFHTQNCRRSYFPYGVTGHRVALLIGHDGVGPGADACVLVKRYQRDTGDIAVQATFSGPAYPWRYAAKLELQALPDTGAAAIRDVTIDLTVATAAAPPDDMAALGIAAIAGPAGSVGDRIGPVRLDVEGPRRWRARIVNDAAALPPVVIAAATGPGVALLVSGSAADRISLRSANR